MANPGTLNEDFQVNGTSLMTYAYNIWTMAGREQVPPVMGDNISVPYRDGRLWVPKSFDQRTLTLGMWVKGTDVNGNIPGGFGGNQALAQHAQFMSNLRALKQLFAPRSTFPSASTLGATWVQPAAPLSLSRTIQYATGLETHTAIGDAYNPSSGGEMGGAGGANLGTDLFDLVPVTPRYGTFTVDIVMADPWWYGTQQSYTFTSVSGHGGANITSIGDVMTQNIQIVFSAGASNTFVQPSLTLQTPTLQDAAFIEYNATIPINGSVTISIPNLTAIDNNGNSVVGNVIAYTNPWFYIPQGGQGVWPVTGAGFTPSGTQTIQFSFYPAYT